MFFRNKFSSHGYARREVSLNVTVHRHIAKGLILEISNTNFCKISPSLFSNNIYEHLRRLLRFSLYGSLVAPHNVHGPEYTHKHCPSPFTHKTHIKLELIQNTLPPSEPCGFSNDMTIHRS